MDKAKKLLKKGNIIVVPTETVYGLAGNAYSNSSIKKIYKLKNRPKKNPLIIHYSNIESLKKDAYIDPIAPAPIIAIFIFILLYSIIKVPLFNSVIACSISSFVFIVKLFHLTTIVVCVAFNNG